VNKRLSLAIVLGVALASTLSGAALASHTHVRELGSGQCAIIAPDGGEKWVSLPDAVFDSNPNVVPGTYAADKRHPLHALVHIPGAGNGMVYVLGSAGDIANCAGYVND